MDYLQSEAVLWGARVSSGHPSPLEAWQALHSNISAKLKYPLPACSLSQKQCKSILYPAIKSALPKAGIAYNLAEAIRDGPISCGGAGITSLYHYQGTVRTALLVEQTFRGTTTGKLLSTCIEDLVLETGLYGRLWNMPFETVSVYTQQHSLLFDIWKYNHKHNVTISTTHGELSPQRQGDIAIMNLAIRHFTDTASLRSIQRIRMAAGIVHLSDLCSADGRALDDRYLNTSLPSPSKNTHEWPTKHYFNRHDMATWRKFVRQLFDINAKYLSNPLGTWIEMDQPTWLDSWDYFVTPDKEILWHRVSSDTWYRHLLKPNARRSYFKEHIIFREYPQTELLRTSVAITPHNITTVSFSTRTLSNLYHENILHFGNLQVKYPKLDWFMEDLISSKSTDRLLYHKLQGSAIGVSDGSFFPNEKLGSCAWILSTPDGGEYIKGRGIIPGSPHTQSSYRSELGGQVGLAAFISQIVLPPSFSKNITVACDGLGALQQVNSNTFTTNSKRKDFDLIALIRAL